MDPHTRILMLDAYYNKEKTIKRGHSFELMDNLVDIKFNVLLQKMIYGEWGSGS